MKIVSNEAYSPCEYVCMAVGSENEDYVIGDDLNTIDEIIESTSEYGIEPRYWELSDIENIPADIEVALVLVSRAENYVSYYPLWVELVEGECGGSSRPGYVLTDKIDAPEETVRSNIHNFAKNVGIDEAKMFTLYVSCDKEIDWLWLEDLEATADPCKLQIHYGVSIFKARIKLHQDLKDYIKNRKAG